MRAIPRHGDFLCFYRQQDRKESAPPWLAFHLDHTSHGIHETFDDRQAQPRSGNEAGFFILNPVKSLKYFFQMLGFNTKPIVLNPNAKIYTGPIRNHFYLPAFGGVVDGIG